MLATSFLLQVFWKDNVSVVKNVVFPGLLQSVSPDLQQFG
jgi:hypothetical protein